MQNNTEKRINRAIGQLNALNSTIASQEYDCVQVITQLKAVMGSIKSLGKHIAEVELERCAQMQLSPDVKKLRINAVLDAAF